MGCFLGRFLLPLLLLAASLHGWSLISLVNLLMFIAFQFTSPRQEFHFWRLYLLSRGVVVFSLLSILAEIIFQILWCIEGEGWSVADAWWAKLIGFVRVQPWGSTSVIYIVVIQLAVALVSLAEAFGSNFYRDSCWLSFSAAFARIGSHLKVACCLFLPAMQLVVGISHPSWISLPFFICSCVGLVDWSLTSNFLGLFRWWRPLLSYACFSILLLHVYQLPVQFPSVVLIIADFIGLFKVTTMSEWPELFSGISLLMYFFMVGC